MVLQELIQLCQRMEALGAAPVLNDGLVGGNAGLLVVSSLQQSIPFRHPVAHLLTWAFPFSILQRPHGQHKARPHAEMVQCLVSLAKKSIQAQHRTHWRVFLGMAQHELSVCRDPFDALPAACRMLLTSVPYATGCSGHKVSSWSWSRMCPDFFMMPCLLPAGCC
jgi:hypothetical protein